MISEKYKAAPKTERPCTCGSLQGSCFSKEVGSRTAGSAGLLIFFAKYFNGSFLIFTFLPYFWTNQIDKEQELLMPIIILGCFLASLVLYLFGGLAPRTTSRYVFLLPLAIFIYLFRWLPDILAGTVIQSHTEWIPSLGVNLSFRLNGLSYLFSLMISGMGALVFYYARHYMQGYKGVLRFFIYLCLFMGSMLGLVLSDNLILLFLFWELTSICSFFLIGFNKEDKGAGNNALMALGITGGGGFFLLLGIVLLGNIAGSFEFADIVAQSELIKNHTLFPILLGALFIGCFTKSAQFPFHFWLPGAMQAPTPVSAYLHSATMVKAGIFLLAKMTPVFSGHPFWNTTLLLVGGVTMVFGAFHSVFKHDMKGILAYSTISALGICVFLIGLDTTTAFVALGVFILTHALYKGALFLTVGIVDQATGTRDVRLLSGLRQTMPWLALGALAAVLSLSGVPASLGFVSKDLLYETSLKTKMPLQVLATVLLFITNMFIIAGGFLVAVKPFFSRRPLLEVHDKPVKKKSIPYIVPVLILGFLTLLFGLWPALLDRLIYAFVHAMEPYPQLYKIRLWHGFNVVLLLSLCTLTAGILLYLFVLRRKALGRPPVIDEKYGAQRLSERLMARFLKFAKIYSYAFQNGYLRNYILFIVIFFIGLVGYKVVRELDLAIHYEFLSPIRAYEAIFFSVIVGSILITVFTPSRLASLASMSVTGYGVCLIFVFYGAPDLAMTQFTIDTLTVVLFVLVLFRLPHFKKYANLGIQLRDGIIALSFGTLISLIALHAFNQPADKVISEFYGDNAYTLAKGKNVVNVILVDFRGTDTMVEIIVLTIAALGVYSMLKLNAADPEKD